MIGLQLLQVCVYKPSLSFYWFVAWNKTFFIIVGNNILVVRAFGYFKNYFVGSNHISKYMFYPFYTTTTHALDAHFLRGPSKD
jgi:hypothetical protein